MKIETANIEKVFSKSIWIESDLAGAKHVMVQHECDTEPFCYCTFNYDYRHTSNSTTRADAEEVAVRLGAAMPIEYRNCSKGFIES